MCQGMGARKWKYSVGACTTHGHVDVSPVVLFDGRHRLDQNVYYKFLSECNEK